MKEVLREVYRTVLIQIADDLTEEQYKGFLFYCTDYVPRKYLNISSTAPSSSLQIFHCLENVQRISWEDLSFLVRSMGAIRREDLLTKLVAFEITRELSFYAWTRQTGPPLNPPASSVGHYLSEMMALSQDLADVGERMYSLLQSGKNVYSILEAAAQPLLAADVEASGNWSTFALLVAIAAEIVSVVTSKAKVRKYRYTVNLATELGNHLSLKLAKLGKWVSELLFSLSV